jgi:predicted Ser/Thr protein kinase
VTEGADAEHVLLAGRYRLGVRIGAGGMGAVHRGVDERLKRDVAIKVLPARALGDAQARERLRREAMAGAALRHPGIAHVYDVGDTDDGGAFLVMELVEGQSLRDLLDLEDWDDRARMAAIVETARALGAAHRTGLVHRDVKPDNVMLRSDGRIVLLDFGIAKPGGPGTDVTLTATGAVVGTPAYLAPEQAVGEPVDARTDQFALAVTAYELLARSIPWPSSSGAKLIAAILRDPPLPLQTRDPALAEAIRPVLDRALSKERGARYPDIDAFADALGEAAGVSVPLRPLTPTTPSSPRRAVAPTPAELAPTEELPVTPPVHVRRRGKWRLSAVVLGLVVVSSASLLSWRARRNPLAVVDPVLACVVFEGIDEGAPAGWLGAAAGSRFCEYAAPALGGTYRHVRFPADLLGLPRHPTDTFPEDPFTSPDARTRSIAEAQRRGLAYADGRVEAVESGFLVTVTLHAPSGRELGSAGGKGESLGEATGAALDGLMASHSLPARAALDGYVNAFVGPRTVQQAIVDTKFRFEGAKGKERLCATSSPPGPGREGWLWRSNCTTPPPEVPRPPPSDIAGVVAYDFVFPDNRPDAERASELEAIRKALPALPDPSFQAAAAMLLHAAPGAVTDPAELAAAELDPRIVAASGGFDSNQIGATDGVGPRTASAWAPDFAPAWRGRGLSKRTSDVEHDLDWWRRFYLLQPDGDSAMEYGAAALRAGRRDTLMALAARLSVSDSAYDRGLSTYLGGRALGADGNLAAAYDKLLGLFPKDADPTRESGVVHPDLLLRTTREIALLLGREREYADWIVDRYVRDGEPLMGKHDGGIGVGLMAAVCSYASTAKARRCLAQLHEGIASSVAGTADVVDAAERWENGDVSGAAAAVRRAMRQTWYLGHCGDFFELVLDAAKLYDLSEEIDRPTLSSKGTYSGENWFTVLRARRAFARGDRVAGLKLARRIVDAWKLADAPVPAVAEMERELAKP